MKGGCYVRARSRARMRICVIGEPRQAAREMQSTNATQTIVHIFGLTRACIQAYDLCPMNVHGTAWLHLANNFNQIYFIFAMLNASS